MSALLNYLKTILSRSTRMFLTIARIMIPVMVIVYIAQRIGLVAWVGHVIAPTMGALGLPPEAGIVWATTILTNIYGGMASLAAFSDGLQMTVAEISALGAMMLFAHNVPTEQSIVRRAGASAFFTGALRIAVGAVYGAGVTWICRAGDWLQQPVALDWMRQDDSLAGQIPDVWTWLWSSVQSLVMIMVVIIFLVCLLDLLERLHITRLITRLLTPVLRVSGVEERAAPLTTVGVLLGLAYGGALIIEAAERENYDARTRLLALSWLSLCHALIEDTVLILALGADIWIILVIRTLVILLVMMALGRLTLPGQPLARWLKI
ncbi:MAG TPA: nucleoside recognition domain-containing protein [Castellaniella sp.]|nr:nucleoside recognition domain-containing protein [Castellaniella sp.]